MAAAALVLMSSRLHLGHAAGDGAAMPSPLRPALLAIPIDPRDLVTEESKFARQQALESFGRRMGEEQARAGAIPFAGYPPETESAAERATPSPSPVCSSPTGPFVVIGVAYWDHLNVRSEPRASTAGEQSNVIAKLPNGTRGISLAEDCLSDWCRIRFGCIEGYVGKSYLEAGGPSPQPADQQAEDFQSIGTFFVRDVSPGDVLNVREAPSASSAVITTIPHNETRVDVSQCGRKRADGVWCLVTYRGRMGWARAAYLLSTDSRLPPRVDLVLDGAR
jgi:SH3-like domain-containing protein